MFRVVLFLLFPLLAFSDHVYWQGNYDKALHQAQTEKKPLLVLVVKRETPLCNEVIKNLFMNQPYIEKINKTMVAVMVTYEGASSYPIELYYTTVFPTLFLVDSQREMFIGEPLYEMDINVTSLEELLH